jgi:hypothetical protein
MYRWLLVVSAHPGATSWAPRNLPFTSHDYTTTLDQDMCTGASRTHDLTMQGRSTAPVPRAISFWNKCWHAREKYQ